MPRGDGTGRGQSAGGGRGRGGGFAAGKVLDILLTEN